MHKKLILKSSFDFQQNRKINYAIYKCEHCSIAISFTFGFDYQHFYLHQKTIIKPRYQWLKMYTIKTHESLGEHCVNSWYIYKHYFNIS